MQTLFLALVLSHLLVLVTAGDYTAIYKATSPVRSTPRLLQKRDGGYQPEFGVCEGDATTCAGACGDGFEECNANRPDALFCYNPTRGQRCCMDGTGSRLILALIAFFSMYVLIILDSCLRPWLLLCWKH